jgi:hypothetical protein
MLRRCLLLSAIILLGLVTLLGSGGSDQPSQTCLVTIHRPADGSVWEYGQTIIFQGSGHNPDDDLPLTGSSLTWSSNLDGSLGTGNTLTTSSLSAGLHAITLSCEDSGSVGSVAISVSILPQ